MDFVTHCKKINEQHCSNMARRMVQEHMAMITSLKSTIADLEAEVQRLVVGIHMKQCAWENTRLHDSSEVKQEIQQDAQEIQQDAARLPTPWDLPSLNSDAFAYALVEATRKDSTGIQLEILTRELYANEVSASSLHVILQECSSQPLCLCIVTPGYPLDSVQPLGSFSYPLPCRGVAFPHPPLRCH